MNCFQFGLVTHDFPRLGRDNVRLTYFFLLYESIELFDGQQLFITTGNKRTAEDGSIC